MKFAIVIHEADILNIDEIVTICSFCESWDIFRISNSTNLGRLVESVKPYCQVIVIHPNDLELRFWKTINKNLEVLILRFKPNGVSNLESIIN